MTKVDSSRVKLSTFAHSQDLTYKCAYRLWEQGYIDGIQLPTGTILVTGFKNVNAACDTQCEPNTHEQVRAVIYARVSNSENKDNLETQAQRLERYCQAKGYRVEKVVKETGSGLNDHRAKLLKLLQDNSGTWNVLVVEHKDRLTRFGFMYLELLTAQKNQRIEVVDDISKNTTDTDDLMADFVSVVTSFCARLYGLRRSKHHTEQLIAATVPKRNRNSTATACDATGERSPDLVTLAEEGPVDVF